MREFVEIILVMVITLVSVLLNSLDLAVNLEPNPMPVTIIPVNMREPVTQLDPSMTLSVHVNQDLQEKSVRLTLTSVRRDPV